MIPGKKCSFKLTKCSLVGIGSFKLTMCSLVRIGSFEFIPYLRFSASLIIQRRLCSMEFFVLDNSRKYDHDTTSHRLNVELAVLSVLAASMR